MFYYFLPFREFYYDPDLIVRCEHEPDKNLALSTLNCTYEASLLELIEGKICPVYIIFSTELLKILEPAF